MRTQKSMAQRRKDHGSPAKSDDQFFRDFSEWCTRDSPSIHRLLSLTLFPSSPSTTRRKAYVIRSFALTRTSAGNRCVCNSQMASAHVFRGFGVGSSDVRGIASACVTMEPRSWSTNSAKSIGKKSENKIWRNKPPNRL